MTKRGEGRDVLILGAYMRFKACKTGSDSFKKGLDLIIDLHVRPRVKVCEEVLEPIHITLYFCKQNLK